MESKAWLVKDKTKLEDKKREEFNTSRAGISGILRTQENKKNQTEKDLEQAFTDMKTLMDKARDMVALAEKFSVQAAKHSEEENSEMRNIFLSMGIASPVTKETAGSLYHSELAKQLAGWLKEPLERHGGTLSLPDVYCLFNRVRGTELISPDDLRRACLLFGPLNLPVRLHRFDSGVLVVQTLTQTDEEVAAQIVAQIQMNGPLGAFDIASSKNISLALATEQLAAAERLGKVCRDETFEGVVYYLNFFADLRLIK